jgi:hypothetical protein
MVIRLSLIYALLDCPLTETALGNALDTDKLIVSTPHLEAALAVWDYCEESAYILFGGRSGTGLGDKLLLLLNTGAMTLTQISGHRSHQQRADCPMELARLEQLGLVRRRKVETGGRPAEVWERA